MPFKIIDLFAGAGGLTEGFRETFGDRLNPVWANDFNRFAVDTYNANFGPHCVPGDIVDLISNPATQIPPADIVVGGPPCQGFSLLNKNREGDIRKELWRPFMEIVRQSGADIFVMENVPQLLNSPEHADILCVAEELGFPRQNIAWAKLCAADYGVPQVRYRAFIIGCRFADPHTMFPPLATHAKPNTKQASLMPRWRNVEDAISDLPPPTGIEINPAPGPLNLHFGRSPTSISQARYRAIPEQGMNRFDLQRLAPELTPDCWIRKTQGGTDLFGRLWWDRPAFTIRTEFYKPEKGRYLHPEQHRPITHREAARLQTFPDTFQFCGSKIEVARQIGNAVPVGLAAAVARSVSHLLELREHG